MSRIDPPRPIALVADRRAADSARELERALQIDAGMRGDLELQIHRVVSETTDASESGIHSLDEVCGAVFVVTASTDPAGLPGVPDALVEAWDACDDVGLPRLIALVDIDAPNAEIESMIEACQESFGDLVPVLAVNLPILSDDDRPIGVIDLLTGQIIDYSSGKPQRSPSEQRHRDLVRDERSWLIEAILAETEDESLVAAFLAGDPIDDRSLLHELHIIMSRGRLHPMCVTAPSMNRLGVDVIVDLIARGFPSTPQATP